MKIAILGHSGAGKSTLAKKLGAHYNIPVLHLDKVSFIENWEVRDHTEALSIVNDFMKNESWVIEGNYEGLEQKRRLKEADQIIFMNFSKWFCFFQALKRYLKNFNKYRDDIADGCIEKFDLEFMIWLLCKGRTAKRKQHFLSVKDLHTDKFTELKNRKDVQAFLDSLQ